MAHPPRSPAPRALLATASVAVALAAADTYVVVLALTDMMRGVGVGIDELQQATPIISGFLLGYVAVLPLVGRLADLVDRQRVLLGCLAVFVVGSAVTALAVELPVLVAGRVVQGVGGGGLVPATLAIVADLWPPSRRGLPLGVVGAVQEVGSVLGPVLGALVLAVADWRAIFWLNAVAGVMLGIAVAATGGGRGSHASRGRTTPRLLPSALGLAALGSGGLALAAPDALVT
ncbi:MAG: MFS transporter, partial [Phycicoccus sp.]